MEETSYELKKKIEAAHEKHAWTLAFLVFGAFGVMVWWLDGWLHRQRGDWAEIAYFVLYVVSFFAVFALGSIKDWFLYKLYDPSQPEAQSPKPVELHFKDAKSALEYSCKYMNTSLADGEFTPCIVIATSQSREAGAFAVIDIPTDSGIKRTTASFLPKEVPPAVVGTLCAAHIGPMIEALGSPAILLFAELEPTWADGAWKIRRRF